MLKVNIKDNFIKSTKTILHKFSKYINFNSIGPV